MALKRLLIQNKRKYLHQEEKKNLCLTLHPLEKCFEILVRVKYFRNLRLYVMNTYR